MKGFLDQLSAILLYGGIVLGVFVPLLLNSRGVKKSRANLFLSILLIALSFSIFHILFAGKVLSHFDIIARAIGDPTFLLIPPALWFYIKELTGNKVRFSFTLILHFIPFISLIVLFFLFKSTPQDNTFINFLGRHYKATAIFFWIMVVVQFSCYQFFIHKRWLAYQKLIEQEVSNTENVNISWIKFFMTVFLLINFFFLINLFIVIHHENVVAMGKITAVIFSLSIYALGYKGILQKEIFHTVVSENSQNMSTPLEITENKTDQDLINRLLAYMEDKKPYLDPELTLSGLAKQMEISRSQLSQLINDGIGDNFYNFINKYRVDQVKKYIQDPTRKNLNMLGLALDAGFKSKSTFNLIFKRFTGLTPTEYRKNISR